MTKSVEQLRGELTQSILNALETVNKEIESLPFKEIEKDKRKYEDFLERTRQLAILLKKPKSETYIRFSFDKEDTYLSLQLTSAETQIAS